MRFARRTLLACAWAVIFCPGASRAGQASATVTGTIEKRDEIWDRRNNPLMGRPDILKEVLLTVKPTTGQAVTLSIKGALLHKTWVLQKGAIADFYYSPGTPPYPLVRFDLKQAAPPVPRKQATPIPQPVQTYVDARLLQGSTQLQEKVRREIVEKYDMTDTSFLFKTSFQGPMPPQGGYKLWGVKGKIKGKWYVWQPGGKDGRLNVGKELIDPFRYQK